jgi:hypothetical protein
MARPTVLIPAEASRIVQDDNTAILVGKPPEILKNLLLNKIHAFRRHVTHRCQRKRRRTA